MQRLDARTHRAFAVSQPAIPRTAECQRRDGAVAVALAIPQASLLWIAAMAVDAGVIAHGGYRIQQVASSAAVAAATEKRRGLSDFQASQSATQYVKDQDGFPDARCVVHRPPTTGKFRGDNRYLEVVVEGEIRTVCLNLMNGVPAVQLDIRSVVAWDTSSFTAPLLRSDEKLSAAVRSKPAPPSPAPPALPPVAGSDQSSLRRKRPSLKDALLVNRDASIVGLDPAQTASKNRKNEPRNAFQSTGKKTNQNADRRSDLGWKSLLGFALITAVIYGLLKLCANHATPGQANDESQAGSAGGTRSSATTGAASARAPPRLFSR